MQDIYDAVEFHSISLYGRLRRLAANRGWAVEEYGWDKGRGAARFVRVQATILLMPGGHTASFTPRSEPEGQTWAIDIRRPDGVVRPLWAEGLIVIQTESRYELWCATGRISDEQLAEMLEDLGQEPL